MVQTSLFGSQLLDSPGDLIHYAVRRSGITTGAGIQVRQGTSFFTQYLKRSKYLVLEPRSHALGCKPTGLCTSIDTDSYSSSKLFWSKLDHILAYSNLYKLGAKVS